MNALSISPLDAPSESLAPAGEAQFAAINEFSGDAIISSSPEGIITRWSSGAERIFGYAAAEVIGQSTLPLLPPDRVYEEHSEARYRRLFETAPDLIGATLCFTLPEQPN